MVDARYSAGDAAYRCLLGQSVAGSIPALFTMFSLNLYTTHFRKGFDFLTLINQETKYIIMKEQLVSFETAKLAKELGFNWKVRTYYGHACNPHIAYDKEDYSIPVDFNSNDYKGLISAPTQSLLNKWIRDVHKHYIDIRICSIHSHNYGKYSVCNVFDISTGSDNLLLCITHKTYEKALEHGLYCALNLIKAKNMKV